MMMPPKKKHGGSGLYIKLIVLFFAGCMTMCGVLGFIQFLADKTAQNDFVQHPFIMTFLIGLLLSLSIIGIYIFKFMANMIIKEQKNAEFSKF